MFEGITFASLFLLGVKAGAVAGVPVAIVIALFAAPAWRARLIRWWALLPAGLAVLVAAVALAFFDPAYLFLAAFALVAALPWAGLSAAAYFLVRRSRRDDR